MRLCAHVRLHLGIAKHLRRNGIMGTILTPEDMLQGYSIHNQAKA